MKFNMKLLTLISLLLTIVSMSVVFAENTDVGSSTFEIPEGYTVNGTFENTTLLTDGESAIIIVESESDISAARDSLEDKGYSFLGENTYAFDEDGIIIHQQNYNKDEYTSCLYVFKKNNKDYIITYTLPEGVSIPSNENNPVTGIIDSLE